MIFGRFCASATGWSPSLETSPLTNLAHATPARCDHFTP
ncbi:hypothetical protein I547_1073 [Mycobacterium kansasii 824]|uniref:Uncharacterized protein n=1 Tax=Mycobacterium kansasii TaxID=1768 RepID=A0A1V3WK00_MYCKA|nr:hypothetical protein I547_1073 [Mycobacterium kansasii 824]OOK67303.1 hypothetical protein BZL30_7509 [Mycobacterium kansasii]OOK83316.1 hypothetical protein BZL29_0340 [Mycobacterium kansasii]